MNADQIKGILRILASAVGPPIVAWLARFGVTPDQVDAFGNALIGMIGAIVPIAMAVWSYYENKRSARAKSLASNPGTNVVIDTNKAPHDLVMSAINPAEPGIITTHEAAMKLANAQATPKARAFGPDTAK